MPSEQIYMVELTKLLSENQEAIKLSWAQKLSHQPQADAYNYTLENLQQLASHAVDGILHSMSSPASVENISTDFSDITQFFNSSLPDIIESLWELRCSIQLLINGLDNRENLSNCLNEYFATLAVNLSRAHTNTVQKEIIALQNQLSLISKVVNTVGSTLDLKKVLALGADAISHTAGCKYGWFYLVSDETNLTMVVTPNFLWNPPLDHFVIEKVGPDHIYNHEIINTVLLEKKPVWVYDSQTDPRFIKSEEFRASGVKSVLILPCLAKSKVVAIAMVITFSEYRVFSPNEIEVAWALANIVAPSIENAKTYQMVEQLSALDERARIAREMHDNLAQTLGAMTVKTSLTGMYLNNNQIELAQSNLKELSQVTKEAYTDIREAIFNLRASPPGGEAFISYLRDYLSTYQTCFQIKIDLIAEGNPTINISDSYGDQILYILQEALTNVRKHANATAIKIKIAKVNSKIQFDIIDDGAGFNVRSIKEDNSRHHFGIQIMNERTKLLDGSLEFKSEPGAGTHILLNVPDRSSSNAIED